METHAQVAQNLLKWLVNCYQVVHHLQGRTSNWEVGSWALHNCCSSCWDPGWGMFAVAAGLLVPCRHSVPPYCDKDRVCSSQNQR